METCHGSDFKKKIASTKAQNFCEEPKGFDGQKMTSNLQNAKYGRHWPNTKSNNDQRNKGFANSIGAKRAFLSSKL